MKNIQKLAVLLLLCPLVMAACKKNKSDDTPAGPLGPNYPQALNNIVTPAIIDSLKKDGMVINAGLTPPAINGIFLFSPTYCIFDNSGDNRKGDYFDTYKLQFQNQNTTQYTVSFSYKDVNSNLNSAADNNATYISGQNNLFTVFAQSKGVERNINYTSLDVVSGQAQNGSMKNMVWSHYMVSKEGDAGNTILVRVGSTRIFNDQDGTSDSQTTFDAMPVKVQGTVLKALSISAKSAQ